MQYADREKFMTSSFNKERKFEELDRQNYKAVQRKP